MQKYRANYANTNPNFVIQNLNYKPVESEYLSVFYIAKNILQRGVPTVLSEYLRKKLGFEQDYFTKNGDFQKYLLLLDNETSIWHNTIKGDVNAEFPPSKILHKDRIVETHNPAKFFLAHLVPDCFGKYAFVQNLILPEVLISEIVTNGAPAFVNQQVDFYLPQVKMVIEIDGFHHNGTVKTADAARDTFLLNNGISTFRVSTTELKNGSFIKKIEEIVNYLETKKADLEPHKQGFKKYKNDDFTDFERKQLLATAIMRFQILVLDLLINDYIRLNDAVWKFNILERDISGFTQLAIEDLFLWIGNLCQLQKLEFKKPAIDIQVFSEEKVAEAVQHGIRIDFSLFKRYTDENAIYSEKIYVRTDYFGAEKNYFKVSTLPQPIAYPIINDDETDKLALRFFLKNIFGKDDFRDGQYPIIVNSLNFYRRNEQGDIMLDANENPIRLDTIGLLPTGGGKSICYQLPCLLQPSINFVVCPIKSLMYDQKDNLKTAGITNTNFISGDLSPEEKAQVQNDFQNGKYLMLFISPERFQIQTFRDYISTVVANFSIAYAVIDEVHCLSEWGHDFRTSYLNLAKTIHRYCPRTNFIGLTATASVNVRKDVQIEFGIADENIKTLADYSRPELVFEVINDNNNKFTVLSENLDTLKRDEGFLETKEKAALIFTPNVNGDAGCYPLSNRLGAIYPEKVKWYAGDIPTIKTKINSIDSIDAADVEIVKERIIAHMENEGYAQYLIDYVINSAIYNIVPTGKPNFFKIEIGRGAPIMNGDAFKTYKKGVQDNYKKDKFPLMVATKAFGMGIDKQNIHYTVHYGLPSSVEALYQEAGRAGRWQKTTDAEKAKKAKCFVLHTHETIATETLDRLFNIETTLAEINGINAGLNFGQGKDIFKHIFLFLQSQRPIENDFIAIRNLLDNHFEENTIQIIWYPPGERTTGFMQRAIYRLSLLGVVRDWTTDFTDTYTVEFTTKDTVLEHLSNYIHKYDTEKPDISKLIEPVEKDTEIEKCIIYLLQWTWDKVVYARRQSLKQVSDLCLSYDEIGNEGMKKAFDEIFRFDDTTALIQNIAENPRKFELWFRIFYQKSGDLSNSSQIETLKNQVSRFLIDYRANTGLNMVSGFIRLFLNDYQNTDGKPRLENALSQFGELGFTIAEQAEIIEKMILLGLHLSLENRYELAQSILKYYPDKLDYLIQKLKIYFILDEPVNERLRKLKSLNQSFHEPITKI